MAGRSKKNITPNPPEQETQNTPPKNISHQQLLDVIAEAEKRIKDLGGEINTTNSSLKEFNKKFGDTRHINKVSKLMEEIDKLIGVLAKLKTIDISADKIDTLQSNITKLTTMKFNTTELDKITKSLKEFNFELQKLGGFSDIINNMDTKNIKAIANGIDIKNSKKRRTNAEIIADLEGKKEAKLISPSEHRDLLNRKYVNKLRKQYDETEDEVERASIQEKLNEAYKIVAKELEDYSSEKRSATATKASEDRTKGTQQAKDNRALKAKQDAQNKLTQFETAYAKEIENSTLSLERHKEYTELQVKAGKIDVDTKKKLDNINKSRIESEEKYIKANEKLKDFSEIYAEEIADSTLSLARFKEYTQLQVDAYKIDLKEKDRLDEAHKEYLKYLGLENKNYDTKSKGITKVPQLNKPDNTTDELKKKELKGKRLTYLENEYAKNNLGDKEVYEMVKLKVELNEITGKERDALIKQYKVDKKRLETEIELNKLKEREANGEELSLKEQRKKLNYQESLGEITSKQAENTYDDLKIADSLAKDEKRKFGRYENSKKISDLRRKEREKYREEQRQESAKRREETIGVFSANRRNVAQRGMDKKLSKLDLDRKLIQSEINNRKTNAKARIANKLTGKLGIGDTSILGDLAEITGITAKESETLAQLKLKKTAIKDTQSTTIKAIDDYDREQIGKINRSNLTNEQKEYHINRLTEKSARKRQEINQQANDMLVENEEAMAATTNKLAGKLTLAMIAIKGTIKVVKELAKVSNEAAQSQAQLISNLQSMGAESSALNTKAISGYTNELKSIEGHWKNIKNEIGDGLIGIGSGFLTVVDEILDAINDMGVLFNWEKSSNKSEDLQSKTTNKSSVKMLGIIEKLEKGVKGIVVDRETSSNALNSVFSALNSTGIDNTSAGNLTSNISDMAVDIASKYGVDYATAMQQLQDAILNGSNSAAQYGINVDDQVLTGWATNEKGIDLANVQYTDAYKAVLRFQLAQEELADGNSDAMTKQIKRWKQLGDVIQTAAGTLFDFQEVQSLQGKDFTIPETDAQGNIAQNITGTNQEQLDKVAELNEKVKETGVLYVMTAQGAMTLADALEYVNGDLSQLCLLYDEANQRYVLATDDYLPSLTQAEQEHFKLIEDRGLIALALYCDQLGLSAIEAQNVAEKAGLSSDAISLLGQVIDELDTIEVDYSDLLEVKTAADQAAKAIADMYTAMGKEVDLDKGTKTNTAYEDELSKYSKHVQDYVRNGYKFDDGTTIDDMSVVDYIFDDDKKETMKAFKNIGNGTSNTGDDINVGRKTALNIGSALALSSIPITGFAGLLGAGAIQNIPGMANGGISTKAHLTSISENNAHEAVIPLSSGEGIYALGEAMKLALGGAGGGINIENLNINNDGINIAENENQWRQVGNRIYEEISIIQRERGDMNYGLK